METKESTLNFEFVRSALLALLASFLCLTAFVLYPGKTSQRQSITMSHTSIQPAVALKSTEIKRIEPAVNSKPKKEFEPPPEVIKTPIPTPDLPVAAPSEPISEVNQEGFELLESGQWQDAATAFTQSLKVNPSDPMTLIGLASIARNQEHDYAKAKAYLEEAVATGHAPPYANIELLEVSELTTDSNSSL